MNVIVVFQSAGKGGGKATVVFTSTLQHLYTHGVNVYYLYAIFLPRVEKWLKRSAKPLEMCLYVTEMYAYLYEQRGIVRNQIIRYKVIICMAKP